MTPIATRELAMTQALTAFGLGAALIVIAAWWALRR